MQGQETEIHHGAKQSEGNKQVGSARKVHPTPPRMIAVGADPLSF